MKTNDPFNTEPLVQKRNEIDAELEKLKLEKYLLEETLPFQCNQ